MTLTKPTPFTAGGKLALIVTLIIFAHASYGQQLYIRYGRVISSFDYEDSQGNPLNNATRTSNNNLAIGFRGPIAKQKLFLTTGVSYNRYGAKASDPDLDNYYTWDVSLVGIDAGVDFEIYKQKNFFIDQDGFTFYVKGIISGEFVIHGTQTINNDLYNLVGEEEFDKPVFFLRGGAGANYCVSRKLSIFIEYVGGKSFLLSNTDGQEKLRYITHTIGFGLLISLPNCDYCHTTL